MAAAAATYPDHISEIDDDRFQDARETLTSSDISVADLPAMIPSRYSEIEPMSNMSSPPSGELSIIKLAKEVLGSVKPGTDVTNVNLPASILDPESTLEKTKKSMQRGELIQDICASTDPITRFLNVIRFNISGLAKERFGKKPYNPVLGEVYRCIFLHRGAGGETLLVAEQVSHHPPISALHLRNDTLGFYMNSHTAPEPRFWGNSLEVKLKGEIKLNLKNFDNEEYIITRPYIHMTGFFAGKQKLEFAGTSTFKCEKLGLGADLEYKSKGPLSVRGEPHGVTGRVYDLNSKETLFTLDGHWDKKITITDCKSNQHRDFFDYESVVMEKSMVAVIPTREDREEYFSTVVWARCSDAIKSGDSQAANAEKRNVEDFQRRLKKERSASNMEWKYRYFSDNDSEGYNLKAEMNTKNLVTLCLTADEIQSLRSGEYIKRQLIEKDSDENEVDGKRFRGRRRLLPHTRKNN